LGQIHNIIPLANSHQLSAKGKKPIYGLLLRPVAFRPTLADGLALSIGFFQVADILKSFSPLPSSFERLDFLYSKEWMTEEMTI
jgi:hypothetical protein